MMTASNIHYELADRTGAITHGGIGLIHRIVKQAGLERRINEAIEVLKQHNPYFESDHVLNIAYNCLCGGQTLQDIELRRNDSVFLDALGAQSIPDPTTAGDFCRRFEEDDIHALMDAINGSRLEVWKRQLPEFFQQTAIIDADGTLVPTYGECKEGMDIGHKGIWGYNPLLVSLANTQEPLFIENRSGNRPSHEGAPSLYDKSIELCRRGGFSDIMLRGDTDFALTAHFDRWDDERGVSFIFGFDATKTMHEYAWTRPESEYHELVRRAEREIETEPRTRPENVKEKIVKQREYKNIKLESEQVVEFDYSPYRCKKTYRVVAVRKNLSVEKGENVLFDEVRFFFYITNVDKRRMKKADVVRMANQRCNQENLIEQLKNGVRALHAPVNTLNANWAYMVMAALAWNLKAWSALSLPASGRWREKHEHERSQLLRMDFRTYLNAFINIPTQIVRTSRRIVYRVLSTNPWQHILFRLAFALRC